MPTVRARVSERMCTVQLGARVYYTRERISKRTRSKFIASRGSISLPVSSLPVLLQGGAPPSDFLAGIPFPKFRPREIVVLRITSRTTGCSALRRD